MSTPYHTSSTCGRLPLYFTQLPRPTDALIHSSCCVALVLLQVPAGVFWAAGAQLISSLCQASELQELCGISDDALCSLKAARTLVRSPAWPPPKALPCYTACISHMAC